MPAKNVLNKLSETGLKKAAAQDKAYNLSDGGGLVLVPFVALI